MRSALLYVALAASLPSFSVLAQRHGGGGGGGGRFFPNGGQGGGAPNTFITVASAAPPAASTPAAAAPPATTAAGSSGGSASSGGSVDASLIPPFGITAGIKANDGTANCVGDGGKGIPCDCPPSLSVFVPAVQASVNAGMAFPSGTSAADQLARLQTCIVTLQNFVGGAGSGVGCPAVSTPWKELQATLQGQV